MPSSDFSGSEASGESFQPIGSLANRKLFTPGFRREPQESQEDQQVARTCPASPKKRKAESNIAVSIEEDALWQAIEKAVARALQAFIGPDLASGSLGDVRSRRREIKDIKDSIDKSQMQVLEIVNSAMAKTRAEVVTMLQGLTQMPNRAPTQDEGRDTVPSDADAQSDRVNQGLGAQNRQKSVPATQPSWAKVVRLGAPTATGWTIVTNGKRKLKKHPLEQRRVLFARNVQSHSCDPRDIMFEVNKALAHARAHATVRLIKMRYTEKGNLTGLLSETACAEDLLHYAPAVMAAVQKLDPEVMYMGKTEKWRKLRVHGVALDRYMGDGGLELVREEIELMMGEKLPYAPRWIKGDTLSERYHGGTVKRSTLVLTVKSKQTADYILAKGLSFGGRRHEAERFWERGEGGMCLRCCGRDHFGKCTEQAKCFVCAAEHEGSEHQCTAQDCGKKSEPCEHHPAKCANCGGQHVAASRKCPERWSKSARQAKETTELRSSPPILGPGQKQSERASREKSSKEDSTPTNPGETTPFNVMKDVTDPISDDTFHEFYKERFGTTPARGASSSPILVQSSSDPTPMSVDDDSAST